MSSGLDFRFELVPVATADPFGSPGRYSLHWFGLTDGSYWLDTPAGRLLEYADPPGRPVEYLVARLFEDLIDIWPRVSEPVPADVAAAFHEAGGNNTEAWDEAGAWWNARALDFSYLAKRPALHLCRLGGGLHVQWDAPDPIWSVPHARFTLPFAEAHDAVAGFFRTFLQAMALRVATIEREGWTRTDCTLDIPRLVAEQPQREGWAAAALSRRTRTDWDEVRRLTRDQGAAGVSV